MKYNVLFVEDEYMVRKNVKSSRVWRQNDFYLAGEASNGEDALKLLETQPIDILLTDIRMPFMDGLDLCAIVRQRWPHIRIVILSGYDDFAYAQRALRLGVHEYLIKPFKVEDLLQVLRAQKESLECARSIACSDRRIQLEKFLNELSSGFLAESTIEKQAAFWQLNLFHAFYVAGVAAIDFTESTTQEALNAFDTALVLRKLLEERSDIFAFSRTGADVHFFTGQKTKETASETAKDFAEALQCALLTCENIRDSAIIIGKPFSALKHIGEAFAEAQFALTMRSPDRKSPIIDVSSLSNDATLQTLALSAEEELLKNLLYYGSEDDIEPLIERLKEKFIRCSSLLFVHAGLNLLATVREVLVEFELNEEHLPMYDYMLELGGCADKNDIARFLELLAHLLQNVLAMRASHRGRKYTAAIGQAQQYIQENYQQATISLPSIAQHVNMSSAYFSSLFRQETGQTLVEYITIIRIENAKRLLAGSSKRTTEISFDVGFTDPNYFSKIFRKAVGMSPREFRMMLPNEEG